MTFICSVLIFFLYPRGFFELYREMNHGFGDEGPDLVD
jgi:hypothetical protein